MVEEVLVGEIIIGVVVFALVVLQACLALRAVSGGVQGVIHIVYRDRYLLHLHAV